MLQSTFSGDKTIYETTFIKGLLVLTTFIVMDDEWNNNE
jgi:hypothetical protein